MTPHTKQWVLEAAFAEKKAQSVQEASVQANVAKSTAASWRLACLSELRASSWLHFEEVQSFSLTVDAARLGKPAREFLFGHLSALDSDKSAHIAVPPQAPPGAGHAGHSQSSVLNFSGVLPIYQVLENSPILEYSKTALFWRALECFRGLFEDLRVSSRAVGVLENRGVFEHPRKPSEDVRAPRPRRVCASCSGFRVLPSTFEYSKTGSFSRAFQRFEALLRTLAREGSGAARTSTLVSAEAVCKGL